MTTTTKPPPQTLQAPPTKTTGPIGPTDRSTVGPAAWPTTTPTPTPTSSRRRPGLGGAPRHAGRHHRVPARSLGHKPARDTGVRDAGSVSIWLATGALVMIVLVGMGVDLSGQVYTQQHARDVARQAARVGGEQLQVAAAVQGQGAVVDPAAARRAATAYLDASDVSGAVTITGGRTLEVDTSAVYDCKFLGIIGISQLTVHGHATAQISRVVEEAAQ